MDASVEALDGDIVLKFNKLLVEEGRNEISASVPQNFIYAFSDTVGEGHGSNRGNQLLILAQDRFRSRQQMVMIYYLTVMAKFRFSMLYLILTLMLGMGHEEPLLFL